MKHRNRKKLTKEQEIELAWKQVEYSNAFRQPIGFTYFKSNDALAEAKAREDAWREKYGK